MIPNVSSYGDGIRGFRIFLEDLADSFFPYPDYYPKQEELLHKSLRALYIRQKKNVILIGPPGVGKSGINVTIANVTSHLHKISDEIEDHFDISYMRDGETNGKSFYTTPQKQLRNQLAEDDVLNNQMKMLRARADYSCGVKSSNCRDCPINVSQEEACRDYTPQCSYWNAKEDAIESDVATITFPMLIVDGSIPPYAEDNERISFEKRDVLICDEAHNLESQAASLFAGVTISPKKIPSCVYGDFGFSINEDAEVYSDIQNEVTELQSRIEQYIQEHRESESHATEVSQCENLQRDLSNVIDIHNSDSSMRHEWLVTTSSVYWGDKSQYTTMATIKPVYVSSYLMSNVWERGRKRVISSATIPYRENISKWLDRIGLQEGRTEKIEVGSPFPEKHRLVHCNTVSTSMSGDSEDENWDNVVSTVEEIHSHHEGENGLIHSQSYERGRKLAQSLDNCLLDTSKADTDAMIRRWEKSDTDIMISPSMKEGVDLHGDICRWQVLLKVPFASLGDMRINYLTQEIGDWEWYYQQASLDIQQSVGRAVRGPEPEEAASFYVIDLKFNDVIRRTNPPDWFKSSITRRPPDHWDDPAQAPWR